MTKRMLIDTTHAEETRVVVMDGERIEDYDVETSSKKQLKGNIYLAKVIRVEPSLQAAFVEYGGNRHGFLAFSEIHPDYFQIPVADREKLLALQDEEYGETEDAPEEAHAETPVEDDAEHQHSARPETVGGENDTGDESAAARRTARFLRGYKIQEVIRRRQILLVQVVKEERGNKGAALTTYVSLAGRYCVLMPNALRGGGVSRKITSDSDRKRLRETIAELDLPRGMAMIVRTAGAQRPAPEITRDCEYLLQTWDDIRAHTLSSTAPTLVYEEASLIKRAIRDLFSKDIEEIMIDGEQAWKGARDFMRVLMPHNVNKVKLWHNQGQSLFARYHVEGHLDAMFSPTAQLKSGGYLVINQTEALVAIDVNSGRSTSQRNVEETALRTNLEAAEEVARQLRLRDLAGLVVIDFIDMESRRHNAQVEKRLKDALRTDRARIQIGHISHFGLLEMSRQRLRPSIAESVLSPCPHCQGTGFVRGVESAALHVLRAIDEEGAKQRASEILVHVAGGVALYILNNKRSWLSDIERRHRMHVSFQADDTLMPSELRIDRLTAQTAAPIAAPAAPQVERVIEIAQHAPIEAALDESEEDATLEAREEASGEEHAEERAEGENGGRRRRRRRRRGGRRDNAETARTEAAEPTEAPAVEPAEIAEEAPQNEAPADEEAATALVAPGRRRTRLRRVRSEERRPHEDRAPRDRHQPQERPAERSTERPAERTSERPAERKAERAPERTQERAAQPERRNDKRAETRNWTGPTPADPFGGRFDIFDAIEMAENAEVEAANRKRYEAPAAPAPEEVVTEIVAPETAAIEAQPVETTPAEAAPAPKGRRGRPRRAKAPEAAPVEITPVETSTEAEPKGEVSVDASAEEAPEAPASKPATRRRTRRKAPDAVVDEAAVETAAEAAPVEDAKPKRGRGRPRKVAAPAAVEETTPEAPVENSVAPEPIDVDEAPKGAPRAGWWRR